MKQAVRIVTWYGFLVAPMIAVLYSNGSFLSAMVAIGATAAISFVSYRNIAQLVRNSRSSDEIVLELDRMKQDFISHVSHELKAPLASMQETTQLMLERIPGPITEKQQRLLNLNLQSGKRLAGMIGNLLDISRLDAGVVEYDMRAQDLGEIARSVVVELRNRIQEKAVGLVVHIPDEPLMVTCDPNRMVQIVSNLLDNAVRFSVKGGAVSLRVCSLTNAPEGAPVPVRSNNGYVILEVGDSGPGIEGAHKKAVFDRFHQVRQGKKTLGQSLGLGLAISRALVEAHKGAIWVEDNPGGGSVFFVLLPKAKYEACAFSQAS